MRKMKDSGFIWLGIIPCDWQIRKVKHYYKMQTGFTPDTKKTEYYDDESGRDWVNISDMVDGKTIFDTKKKISQEYVDKYQPEIIPKGSLMYSFKLSVGQTSFAGKDLYSNEAIASFLSDEKVNLHYLRYSSMFIIENAQTNIYNAKILNQDLINNAYVPFPPLTEQQKIAAYLDIQCAHIDSVIEKTKQSIEEYKKLKQAVITQAVTKGVRGEREMKDSGVEWIEQIPSEWSMERGKKLFYETNTRSENGEEELLTVSQYTGVTPRSQKNVNMFEAESLEGYKVCEIGDIAANTMWLWAGAIGVSEYYGVISPSYNIYRQRNNDYNSKYLDYLLRIPPIVQHYESLSTGIRASRLRLYPQQFLSIYYPVPPISEQSEIVEYLKEKIVEVDKLITKKEQFLTELESYKKSMIYEYVTGKKEVEP